MKYAEIIDGAIAQIIETETTLPAHKLRPDLLPVEIVAPEFDAETEALGEQTMTVEETRVVQSWEVIAKPPMPVPPSIKASQARVALHRAGLIASVTALVDNPATDAEIKIFWEYEVELNRDSPALNLMAGALGLTSQQLDDLFRTAVGIAV